MNNIIRVSTLSVLQPFKLVSKQRCHLSSLINNLQISRPKSHRDGAVLLIHPRYVSEDTPILFKTDLFNGGKLIPFENLNFGRPRNRFRMLKPVNGLVCLFGDDDDSVLIYNPSTGEKTSWIETTKSSLLLVGENIDDDELEKLYSYNYFGFGFDPNTQKHKVVRICEIFKECNTWDWRRKPKVAFHRACEVLTVGENTWRKIDAVPPPYNLSDGSNYGTKESLYVNGVIFWVDDENNRPENIVAFDIINEKFRVIKTPRSPRRYSDGVSQSNHLVEVDGRIALLDCSDSDIVFLWKFNDGGGTCGEDSDDDDENNSLCDEDSNSDDNRKTCGEDNNDEEISDDTWIEKWISLPFDWSGKSYLSFQAIAGTDLIILHSCTGSEEPGELCYYDLKKHSLMKVKIHGDSSFPIECGYEISTFVESLFPIQN